MSPEVADLASGVNCTPLKAAVPEQIAVGCVGPPVCRKPTAIGTSTPLFRGRAALIVVVPQGIPCGTIAIMDVEAPGSSPAFRWGSGLAVTGVTCVAVSSSLGLRRLGSS